VTREVCKRIWWQFVIQVSRFPTVGLCRANTLTMRAFAACRISSIFRSIDHAVSGHPDDVGLQLLELTIRGFVLSAISTQHFNTPLPLFVGEEALLDPSTLVVDKELPSLATHTVFLSRRKASIPFVHSSAGPQSDRDSSVPFK
jgi:hypothetical protein